MSVNWIRRGASNGSTYLVSGVLDDRLLPRSASRNFLTDRVGNHIGNPISILFVVPFLGLFRVGVRDELGFLGEPVCRHGGGFINDGRRRVLVPVGRLFR
jgi:hypothetical protein